MKKRTTSQGMRKTFSKTNSRKFHFIFILEFTKCLVEWFAFWKLAISGLSVTFPGKFLYHLSPFRKFQNLSVEWIKRAPTCAFWICENFIQQLSAMLNTCQDEKGGKLSNQANKCKLYSLRSAVNITFLQGREHTPTTNSTHIWCRVRESNPGHIGGRRALSPLRHPCSP